MDPDLQFELKVLRRRLATAQITLALLVVAVIAAIAWAGLVQARSSRTAKQLTAVQARVDSLSTAADASHDRIDPLEQRVESLGAFDDRLHESVQAKASRRALAAMSDRLDTMSVRIDRTDAHAMQLDQQLAQLESAQADSIAAIRGDLEAALSALRDTTREQGTQLADATQRIEAVNQRVKTWGRHAIVRDGITAVTAGILVAHLSRQ